MKASVVVRSKDECERLRLTLAALARQTARAEVIVVNDGSSDATPEVLSEAAPALDLTVVTHREARGRSAASNAGAAAASGDILMFIDGDTFPSPEFVASHLAMHAQSPSDRGARIGRGRNFHFRSTRFLQDPETGSPRRGEEARLARFSPEERHRARVTRAMIAGDFERLAERAELGIYPGAGPRRLQEVTEDALLRHPACTVNWVAAEGSNLSLPADLFRAAGGYDERIDINEHRELALRLAGHGTRVALVPAARTFHLTHRSGWRNPLEEATWEAVFWRKHPIPAVKLLAVFWASLGDDRRVPAEARIETLPALESAARDDRGIDYDAVRHALGLTQLVDPASASPPREPALREERQ